MVVLMAAPADAAAAAAAAAVAAKFFYATDQYTLHFYTPRSLHGRFFLALGLRKRGARKERYMFSRAAEVLPGVLCT